MITLKEALKLSKEETADLKKDLKKKIEEKRDLGAYVEQLTGEEIFESGDGVPVLIKDNISVKGFPLTCASKILQGYKAPYNATVIEKMFGSGLSAYGRANMDEFAMGSSTETSYYGRTLNPVNPKCVPGGSSGGSASAVGAGIAIAALGSDTGGSIRQPASFCGIVGMKPTYGRVSRYGLSAFSSSLDQIGPMTQNVEDAAILYDILAGFDKMDSTSSDLADLNVSKSLNPDRKLKIAVIENYISQTNDDVRKACEDAVKAMEDAGHTIIRKNMSNTEHHLSAYYVIAPAEASANLSRYDGVRYGNREEADNLKDLYFKTRTEGFGDEVKRRILLGTFVLSSGYYDAYYKKAQKVRHLIKDEFEEIFKEADLIFTPTAPTAAFEFGAKKDPLEMYMSDVFTISTNLAGLPGISLPVGKDGNGMPIGAQLIGRAYDEQTLFDGAMSLENILK